MEERFELGFLIGNFTMERLMKLFFGRGEVSDRIENFTMVTEFGGLVVGSEFGQKGFDGGKGIDICLTIFDANVKTNSIRFVVVVCKLPL